LSKPNFDGLHQYAKTKAPRAKGPQAVLPHERIYRCECCNDTGVAQVWKLNKWAFPNQPPLDTSSYPVFCCHFNTCGNVTMQVFTDNREQEDGQARTETLNLFNTPSNESTTIGKMIGRGQAKVLSHSQSKYIHDSVLDYRAKLAAGPGKAWVEQVKAACRNAMPTEQPRGTGGLTKVCVAVDLPPEPDFDAPPAVEVTAPKDLISVGAGPTPPQPDGPITLDEEFPL
jgi:hypothetical protein